MDERLGNLFYTVHKKFLSEERVNAIAFWLTGESIKNDKQGLELKVEFDKLPSYFSSNGQEIILKDNPLWYEIIKLTASLIDKDAVGSLKEVPENSFHFIYDPLNVTSKSSDDSDSKKPPELYVPPKQKR